MVGIIDDTTAAVPELPERAVGQVRLRDPAAAVGLCAGGVEPTARLHRLQQLRHLSASVDTTHLAHTLEPVRVLQPQQGQGHHHRHVPLQAQVSNHTSTLRQGEKTPLAKIKLISILKPGILQDLSISNCNILSSTL